MKAFCACLLALACGGYAAQANTVTVTTAAGSDSDGPLAATVAFTAVTGGIEITITNTESGTLAKGQSVSSLSFAVNGLSTPSNFTKLTGVDFDPASGNSWTLSSGSAFSDTSSAPPVNAIDHWGFQTTGSTVLLATAGSPVPGSGNPLYLIIPASGTAGPANSLADSHFEPYIIGPANFFLTVSGVTSNTVFTTSDFTAVDVGFGTGPDKTLAGGNPTLSTQVVPLPPAC